jgi:L-arabinonolactonase
MQIATAAKRENILGEGPLWSFTEGRLYWVDIEKSLLEWLSPGTGEAGVWQLPCRASAVVQRASGGLLLATERGFALFDGVTGAMEIVKHPEPDRHRNRTNDGHCDQQGGFWVGTMDDTQQQRSGALYRLAPDWTCQRMLDGLGIPNTVLCTPAGDGLYVADSQDQALYLYSLDADSGALGSQRPFADTLGTGCTPDGSALDANGFLWNAQWGGWRLVRYAPDGEINRVVLLPVEQPTSCAFGGEDLSTLYITTARKGLSREALERQPLAGSVLSFRADVPGFEMPMFGG